MLIKKRYVKSLCFVGAFSLGSALFASQVELDYGGLSHKYSLKRSTDYVAVQYSGDDFQEKASTETLPFTSTKNLGSWNLVKVSDQDTFFKDHETKEIDTQKLKTMGRFDKVFPTYFVSEDDRDHPMIPTGLLCFELKKEMQDNDIAFFNEFIGTHKLLFKSQDGNEIFVESSIEDPVPLAFKFQNDKELQTLFKTIEPDFSVEIKPSAWPFPETIRDGHFEKQWHLENQAPSALGRIRGADARVTGAWRLLETAFKDATPPIVRIAVLDDGFDIDHPSFEGIVEYPRDFESGTNDPRPRVFIPLSQSDRHGTACAGVALSTAGASKVLGGNPYAKLIPMRWAPSISGEQIREYFNYVLEHKADVMSNSWGTRSNVYVLPKMSRNAIARFARNGREGKGGLIVFAAGNDNHDINNLPFTYDGFAVHPDVIAVSASSSIDRKSWYSNFGKEILVAAPSNGQLGIVTTDVRGEDRGYSSKNTIINEVDYNDNFGGTSSSCPLVAGIISLVLTANPNLTAEEVKDILRKTARIIDQTNGRYQDGHSIYYGYGCINAEDAVRRALEMRQAD